MKQSIQNIPLDQIKDPERPMRTNLTPESVDDLVFSIKEVGIIQPLTVCKSGDKFEIIAGHRRFMAAEVLRLNEVPCIVIDTKDLDKEVLKMHENIGRADISPIDWANHLDYLKSQYNLSNAKLAELTGFSASWVNDHLEVLNYPAEVIIAIKNDDLSFSAARELARIKDPIKREVYVKAAVRGGVTPALAARWKVEANRSAVNYTPQPDAPDTENTENSAQTYETICPVCKENVPIEEAKTITIHTKCAPQ